MLWKRARQRKTSNIAVKGIWFCACGRRLRPQLGDQPHLLKHLLGNGDPGHLGGDVAAGLTTFAAISISFSFRLVSDQSFIGSGVASVRRAEMPTAPYLTLTRALVE
jgi:hypothetical protein